MATYQHGVYNQEQATSLTTPIQSSAALQVIFGTAPIHLADDPAKAANTPKLCYSFAEPGRRGVFRRLREFHALSEH